jgi:hypothetical protein
VFWTCESAIVKTVNLCSISIFSCCGLSVFVESLESLSENHNLSFNVDAGCFQILNPTKSN